MNELYVLNREASLWDDCGCGEGEGGCPAGGGGGCC